MEFRVGDVVRLLSGGCKMTVNAVNPCWVFTTYHDGEGKPHNNIQYNPLVLYKVSPGDE